MKFIILIILVLSVLLKNVNSLNINNLSPLSLSSSSSTPSSMKCEICELLVGRIEIYLEGNATQNQIEYYLDKDCKTFGGEYASPCTVYVNEYVPILINYMANHEKPNTACEQINLC